MDDDDDLLVEKVARELIVTDIQLPDISGLEVIRALKSDDRTRRIPVIAITASPADAAARARDAGCDAFMTKPVDTGQFLAAIKSFLPEGSHSRSKPSRKPAQTAPFNLGKSAETPVRQAVPPGTKD